MLKVESIHLFMPQPRYTNQPSFKALFLRSENTKERVAKNDDELVAERNTETSLLYSNGWSRSNKTDFSLLLILNNGRMGNLQGEFLSGLKPGERGHNPFPTPSGDHKS